MKRRETIIILASILLLSGCGKNAEFPIPPGIQTIRAILKPVPFSLKRRGTHALIASDGQMAAYAESSAVNLHSLEGREVEFQGIFEKNTNPADLPVFVVQKVIEGGNEDMRPWAIPSLSLSLQLPRNWKGTLQGKSASFTAPDSTDPLLTITVRSMASLSDSPMYGPAPLPMESDGDMLVVGLRKATAAFSAGHASWTVTVPEPLTPEGNLEVVFTFAVRPDLPTDQQLSSYRNILRSVTFSFTGTSSVQSSSSARFFRSSSSSAGSAQSRAAGDGAPCGGIAGILCPSGLYCRIIDPASDSGLCAKR